MRFGSIGSSAPSNGVLPVVTNVSSYIASMTKAVTNPQCRYCRKPLAASTGRPPKYCSSVCRQAVYRRRQHQRPGSTRCAQCKKKFKPPQSGRPPKYCSPACRQAAYLKRKASSLAGLWQYWQGGLRGSPSVDDVLAAELCKALPRTIQGRVLGVDLRTKPKPSVTLWYSETAGRRHGLEGEREPDGAGGWRLAADFIAHLCVVV
jgi:hypothetical protein